MERNIETDKEWARRKLRRIVRRALINAAITTMCLELLEGLE